MILPILLLLQVKVSISQIVIGSACDNSRDFAIKCSPNGGLAYCSDSIWYEQPCVTGSTCKYDSVSGASCVKACNEPRSTIYMTLTSTRIVSSTIVRSTTITSVQRTSTPLKTSTMISTTTSSRTSTSTRIATPTTSRSTLTTMFSPTTSTAPRSTTLTSTTSKMITSSRSTTKAMTSKSTTSTAVTATRSSTTKTTATTPTTSASTRATTQKASTPTSTSTRTTRTTTTILPTVDPVPSINTSVVIEIDYHVLNYVGVNVSLPNFVYDPYETSKVQLLLPLGNENDEVLSIKSEQLAAFRCEYLLQYSESYNDDQWISCDWSQKDSGLSLSWVYISNNVTSHHDGNTTVTLSAQLMVRTNTLSDTRIFESPIVGSFIAEPTMNSTEMFSWQPINGTIEPIVAWKVSPNFDQNNYEIQQTIKSMEDSDIVNEEPSLKMPFVLFISTLGGGIILFLVGSTMTSITAYRFCTKDKAID